MNLHATHPAAWDPACLVCTNLARWGVNPGRMPPPMMPLGTDWWTARPAPIWTTDPGTILGQRDHYLAGCGCPRRSWCIPHAFSGTTWEHHGICADHDHVAPDPDPLRPLETDRDPDAWADDDGPHAAHSEDAAPLREEGIVQRPHIACCWCGEHHEEGK